MIKIQTYLKTKNNTRKINFKKISKKIAKAINSFIKKDGLISVIIVDNEKIKKMNKKYRLKDYVTDVLSFESVEKNYFGDVFICLDKVFEQAQEYNHSINREYAFLLVHGLLHLLGYGHESKEEEEKMFELQERILDYAKYKR